MGVEIDYVTRAYYPNLVSIDIKLIGPILNKSVTIVGDLFYTSV
jgi:hypothetical protein